MKKRLKRLVSVIVSAALMISCIPTAVFAASDSVKVQGYLSGLAFSKTSTATFYETDKSFDGSQHEYTVYVPDNTGNLYIKATLNSGITSGTITETHTSYTNGAIKTNTLTSDTAKNISLCVPAVSKSYDALENTCALTVLDKSDSTTQTYNINVKRVPMLSNLSATVNGESARLSATFAADTKDYSINIPSSVSSVTVDCTANSNTAETYIEGVKTNSAEISITKDITTVSCVAKNSAGKTSEYVLTINRLSEIATQFVCTPADATVYVCDSAGDRVYDNDGVFSLMAGLEYTYVVSKNGYVAQSETFVAGNRQITATLKTAEENTSIDTSIISQWSDFRGNAENNAVTEYPTPTNPEDAVLYWAEKKGEGYSGGAVGCPIIVDDYLVFNSGKYIFKMNRFTGETVASGEMSASSTFNIIPPTYADGMIFVGLSNGTIQAFNADTLESLWVFQDELKGQPNSPIKYNNGYIYTGFWNSETKDANFVCISVTDENILSTNEIKHATWKHTQAGGFYWASAYCTDDYVIVGTDDGASGYLSNTSMLLSLDSLTGKVIDKIENLNGDIRSCVSYDAETDSCCFTSKGGSFYGVKTNSDGTFTDGSLKEVFLSTLLDYDTTTPPMSTSTPCIAGGRAYVGVSGVAQFGANSGHNITVIDLDTFTIAYQAYTNGYPQTSVLLATNAEDGYNYVYFITNMTPGSIYYIKDKKGVNEVIDGVYNESTETTFAPVIFTPAGAQAQYAICSPIVDEYGTIYMKNDSAYMMAVGSKIESIEVVNQPSKVAYSEGSTFDNTGIKIVANYANGLLRDITDECTYPTDEIGADDEEVMISYDTVMYYNGTDDEGNYVSTQAEKPTVYVEISVVSADELEAIDNVITLINDIGEVNLESGLAINLAREVYNNLAEGLKASITNYNTLVEAEAMLANLVSVNEVENAINEIGEVTLESGEQIANARAKYNALNDDLKTQITNLEILENAEKTFASLVAVDDTIKAIENIGEVTLESEDKIILAREKYDALTEDEKSQVTNIDVLNNAELALDKLKELSSAIFSAIDELDEYIEELKVDANSDALQAVFDEYQQKLLNASTIAEVAEILQLGKEVADKLKIEDTDESEDTSAVEDSSAEDSTTENSQAVDSEENTQTDNPKTSQGAGIVITMLLLCSAGVVIRKRK